MFMWSLVPRCKAPTVPGDRIPSTTLVATCRRSDSMLLDSKKVSTYSKAIPLDLREESGREFLQTLQVLFGGMWFGCGE